MWCVSGSPRAPSWILVVTRLTSYPFRFSNTSALAPCLPQFCFSESLCSPCFQGGGDNPPGLRCCRLLTCGPSSSVWLILRSGWVLAPRSVNRGTWIVRGSKGCCQAPPLGTSFPNLGQFRPKRPKTGAKGAIGTHRGLHSAPTGRSEAGQIRGRAAGTVIPSGPTNTYGAFCQAPSGARGIGWSYAQATKEPAGLFQLPPLKGGRPRR